MKPLFITSNLKLKAEVLNFLDQMDLTKWMLCLVEIMGRAAFVL
jgi:hypothetical protein